MTRLSDVPVGDMITITGLLVPVAATVIGQRDDHLRCEWTVDGLTMRAEVRTKGVYHGLVISVTVQPIDLHASIVNTEHATDYSCLDAEQISLDLLRPPVHDTRIAAALEAAYQRGVDDGLRRKLDADRSTR